MSHIVTIKTEVRDATAVEAACGRLGVERLGFGRHKLFAGEQQGLGVKLSGWMYPVVCELPTGRLFYDNFGGRWGEQRELDRFLQMYAVERAKLEARKKGYGVREQVLADGSIKVTVEVTGGAA